MPWLAPIWQVVAFALFSFLSVALYWRFVRGRGRASDQPLLNRRAEQLVGRVVPLDGPMLNGRGRVKIGDAFWTVEGPDLPSGTPVRIHSVNGMTLRVISEA